MKILKNKGVKFGAIIAAVAVLALLIYFCVRPVSVGFTYSAKNEDQLVKSYHFNTFTKYTVTSTSLLGSTTNETEGYYFENEGEFVQLLTDEEDYEDAKELAIKLQAGGEKINAFVMGEGEDAYVCGGAIAMVSVLAVIELALVGVIVLSCMPSKKKAKSKGKK